MTKTIKGIHLCALFLLFCAIPAWGIDAPDSKKAVEFSHFSVDLPSGWGGDEQKGFISDNPEEYLLTLGKKDEKEDRFIAQISVFLLPNKPGVDSREAAERLAHDQGDSTKPTQDGKYWTFEGEPRTRAISGRGITKVMTNPQWMLIIIAQDPLDQGAKEILGTLKPNSDITRELLK